MVRGHSIAHVSGDAVFLQAEKHRHANVEVRKKASRRGEQYDLVCIMLITVLSFIHHFIHHKTLFHLQTNIYASEFKSIYIMSLGNDGVGVQYVVGADLSELLVESHLICKHADVMKKVWLHVAPHVRKPPEFLSVSEQGVVTFILFIRTCTLYMYITKLKYYGIINKLKNGRQK